MNRPEDKDALYILKETSRTFYIPISQLPSGLKEAVTSAYLCMRAIDEIEDHPDLDSFTKAKLLRKISLLLQEGVNHSSFPNFSAKLDLNMTNLPEVTKRVGEWAILASDTIAPRIWDVTAAMADRMAYWAENNWAIHTESDLDRYTFSVAGAVGLLLSDLWSWYDNTNTNRTQAIGFGRGLQAVNILRNHSEDLVRGVDFFPNGWVAKDMQAYAQRNLLLADSYTNSLPSGPARNFCQIPLTLAHATLDILTMGQEKLSRSEVMELIYRCNNSA
ncbi:MULTISPECIES: squalene/phytoene synthase family protein [Okeania]|uniref:Phytoene/squalene synthase family protein n=1 Tax=Okeania hirsuta TaxID=1458930 RepID=A0A3N6NXE3_9CYAN|nr:MULTISPECIES: phytoene/squalene synthase family protein [Okeania]NEP05112.1 phytoene/squalene synthase family protein [Okeania sp. SIO4D6]NET15680.1 phytoene/squalene synthase family protein [Okeania sp. SIO1H6]NEP70513.1 phytoene/squalene synthase family protein [Okeania sp. SIO2G5]NEP92744.1 phytoene/squalene synthase family protein [Okeania sp. SIO2F5]NEQ90327.1 phytoene/squalene synthase family protein [Okeania sp. SIO2G4]